MRRNRKGQGNLFFFPELDERLVEKGIQALKGKEYHKARDLFEQLTELSVEHPQAAYGLSICYVELGDYEKAEVLTTGMLKKDIGNYYDVLRLHLTVLIQMRHYEKVITIIDKVLEENDVPLEMGATLQQLAEFSRVRLDEKPAIDFPTYNMEKTLHSNEKIDLAGLKSEDPEQQWLTVQKLQHAAAPINYPELEQYLLSNEGDPFIKSVVLRTLKDNGFDGIIRVKKFGNIYELAPEIDMLFYETFSEKVKEEIREALSSDNPTLCDFAEQIWQHFIVALYPKPLDPDETTVWAAACCLYTYQINGIPPSEHLVESLNFSSRSVQDAVGLMTKVEESSSENKF